MMGQSFYTKTQMSNERPVSNAILRKIIAHKAWDIWTQADRPSSAPDQFYSIADMAIQEVYDNVDKMITESIRQRLENLL